MIEFTIEPVTEPNGIIKAWLCVAKMSRIALWSIRYPVLKGVPNDHEVVLDRARTEFAQWLRVRLWTCVTLQPESTYIPESLTDLDEVY